MTTLNSEPDELMIGIVAGDEIIADAHHSSKPKRAWSSGWFADVKRGDFILAVNVKDTGWITTINIKVSRKAIINVNKRPVLALGGSRQVNLLDCKSIQIDLDDKVIAAHVVSPT